MKKEEYLKQFKEFDDQNIARAKYVEELYKKKKEYKKEYRNMTSQEELVETNSDCYNAIRERICNLCNKIHETRQKINEAINAFKEERKKVFALLKKAFNDPDLYIKTNRVSFTPKIIMINNDSTDFYNIDFYNIPGTSKGYFYSAYLPVSNNKDKLLSIYTYIEQNAVNCESRKNRELLKEINGEVNHKGDYCLIVTEEINPWIYSWIYLYYGKLSTFEATINSIKKKEEESSNILTYDILKHTGRSTQLRFYHQAKYYIKYFDSFEALNNFLYENILLKNIFVYNLYQDNKLTDIKKNKGKGCGFPKAEYESGYKNLISKMEELK